MFPREASPNIDFRFEKAFFVPIVFLAFAFSFLYFQKYLIQSKLKFHQKHQ